MIREVPIIFTTTGPEGQAVARDSTPEGYAPPTTLSANGDSAQPGSCLPSPLVAVRGRGCGSVLKRLLTHSCVCGSAFCPLGTGEWVVEVGVGAGDALIGVAAPPV